jgi:hypothetical protein
MQRSEGTLLTPGEIYTTPHRSVHAMQPHMQQILQDFRKSFALLQQMQVEWAVDGVSIAAFLPFHLSSHIVCMVGGIQIIEAFLAMNALKL